MANENVPVEEPPSVESCVIFQYLVKFFFFFFDFFFLFFSAGETNQRFFFKLPNFVKKLNDFSFLCGGLYLLSSSSHHPQQFFFGFSRPIRSSSNGSVKNSVDWPDKECSNMNQQTMLQYCLCYSKQNKNEEKVALNHLCRNHGSRVFCRLHIAPCWGVRQEFEIFCHICWKWWNLEILFHGVCFLAGMEILPNFWRDPGPKYVKHCRNSSNNKKNKRAQLFW